MLHFPCWMGCCKLIPLHCSESSGIEYAPLSLKQMMFCTELASNKPNSTIVLFSIAILCKES